MTQTPEPADPSVADAEAKLARLGVQVEAMQALLTRLLQDVVSAETRLDQNQAARLVEANEQLVLAALASQADAETAAKALQNAAQATVLDALTGLPNRTALLDRFVQAIANAKRRGSRFALLFVDLDNFKELNDTHGHAFGDKVLCLAAKRMLAAVREVDTVSRHGGDEFLILLAELNQPRDARTVAEKLIAAVGAPAVLDGQAVSVTASVGITLYPDDGEDFDTLVARADAAMYESKRQRAGGIAFHGVGSIDEAAPQAHPGAPARPAAGQGADEAIDSDHWHAQLREANEKLVLAALTAQELQAAADQARQRQAAFVAAVADELRNPLAPIRIASAMLGRAPTDEALLPRVQGMVEQQMTQMSRLVGDLIDASNVEAGGFELERRSVDLARVIDAAVAAHRPMLEQRAQRFESQRPAGALPVQGDAARLEQIVSNLLDNASKYTPDGGGIRLAVAVTADTLTLTVSDDGIGITAQMLPYVFEPFVQDTRALGFHGVGLGIGLTVVRALVRAHGGTLVAHSAGAARGSQFVVTLPLAASAPAAPGAQAATGDAGPGP